MEITLLTASLGAIVGAILAATGAGGGILAVLLLVFALHLSVAQAAPMGLVAIGFAAALGAGLGLREGILRYRAAALIGLVGIALAPLGVAIAARVPNRPMMMAFAFVLALSAWRTLQKARGRESRSTKRPPCAREPQRGRLLWTLPCARALAGIGALSGFLSGLLGVGGGFVIVPALGRLTDLSQRSVLATSLGVIAMVSSGAIAAAAVQGRIDWAMTAPFALGAAAAMLAIRPLVATFSPSRLMEMFGWLSAAVAVLLFWRAWA